MNKIFFFILASLLLSLVIHSQTIELTIKNIRSQEGQLCVAVFDSEEGFKNEEPFWAEVYPKTFDTNEFVMKVELAPGEYGITVLDDENMDFKMNYTKIGLPKEGFGFGGYKYKGFLKPSYNKFKFTITENQKINLEVELKYYL